MIQRSLFCAIFTIGLRYFYGHSKQAAVFIYREDAIIFTGDAIFRDRYNIDDDFIKIEGFSFADYLVSIKNDLLSFPDNFLLAGGHYLPTKIAVYKKEERFLRI